MMKTVKREGTTRSYGRSSGVILHPTSLPGPFGIGSLGHEAFRFVDFLASAGQSIWQILPLNPTGYGDSPYSAFSAFAGNPLLICLERLVEMGDLDPEDIAEIDLSGEEVNYGYAHSLKTRLLRKAAKRFHAEGDRDRKGRFEAFCAEQEDWLDDYALYRALRHHFDEAAWNRWPEDVRNRKEEALCRFRRELAGSIYAQEYAQFIFFEQWSVLKEHAAAKGVRIMGDIPIFVAYDSSDVWSHPDLFHLDASGAPVFVAGVPPDYFSETGQRWGNPLYRWEEMASDDYSWWKARFHWNLTLYDLVRVDHFRGFESCWAIPVEEKTAVRGHWMPVPGEALFRSLGDIPVLAEDLGVITPEVDALRESFGFPGMKVLQFAFGSGPENPYLPHNFTKDCAVYTGTHDNNTSLGWWKTLRIAEKNEVLRYLGCDAEDVVQGLMRAAMESVADLCIFPLQDVLGLDETARMNIPGKPRGNWKWRFKERALSEEVAEPLLLMTKTYGRA